MDPQLPPETPTEPCAGPAPAAGPPFGRYVLLSQLGRGGMGVVWKAYDPELKRVVALKQALSEMDPAQVERFAREAQAAARLRHPGIVAVHDVGCIDGRHYFTADYVEGRPLDALPLPLPARQAAEVVRGVAEALAYAHGQGILHRDVKPANILLDGEGRPHVMDFGLAKDLRKELGESLTISGQLLGTPAYMSPEQARGEVSTLGPASDQFSLGAVLYQLLTARRPFEGLGLMGTLEAVSERDPVPPGRLHPVQRDVETICMKSLEKDPLRRYASMSAFADDLGRYLAGEPIAARPLGALARLWRRGLKKRAVVLPTAAALAFAAALVAYWAVAGMQRRGLQHDKEEAEVRSAKAERDLEKSQRISEVFSLFHERLDLLAELETDFHDSRLSTEEKRKRSEARWGPFEDFLAQARKDTASQATAWALAGWARRLAGHEDEGIEWMRKATRVDPDIPYGAMMEALVCFSRYLAWQPLPTVASGATGLEFGPPPGDSAELVALRERMTESLDRVARARVWGKGTEEEVRATLAGVRAMQQGDLELAERGLSKGLATADLALFQVDLRIARAKVRYLGKRFSAGVKDLEEARRRWPESADACFWLGTLRFGEAVERLWRGQDPREVFDEAIAQFGEAVQRSPESVGAYNSRGDAYAARGAAEEARGLDPRGSYAKAIADFGTGLLRDPESGSTYNLRGTAYAGLGQAEASRGLDPRGSYQKALADYGEALRRDPESVDARNNRGNLYQLLGWTEEARGLDPRGSFQNAIADFDAALQRNPECVLAYNGRGIAHENLGRAEDARGVDPRENLRKAIADYGEALRRNPEYAKAYNNRGATYAELGLAEEARGLDPRESYQQAIADEGEALRRNPEYALAYFNRGNAYTDLGRAEETRGLDPRGSYRKAIAEFDEALQRNPEFARGYFNRGNVYRLVGKVEASRESDPRGSFQEAIANYDEALKRNPEYAEVYANRGCAYGCLAEAEASRGLDPMGSYRKAIADEDVALSKNPTQVYAHIYRGLLLDAMGRSAEAVQEFEAMLRLHPGQPDLELYLAHARARAAGGEAPAWVKDATAGQRAIGRGDDAAARDAYERTLAEAGESAEKDPASRALLRSVNYDLARVYALLSIGKSAPDAEAKGISPEDVARHRECAFQHLCKALELGYADKAHLAADADLAPLHDDPRWKGVMERISR